MRVRVHDLFRHMRMLWETTFGISDVEMPLDRTNLSVVHEVKHHLHVRCRRVDPDPDAVHGGEVIREEVQYKLVHLQPILA